MNLLQVDAGRDTFQANSEREAWMAFFAVAVAADGKPSNIEIACWASVTHMLNVFDFVSQEKTFLLHEMGVHRLKFGSKALIEGSLSFIHVDSRETLYTLCADIIISKGVLNETGCKVLGEIQAALSVPDSLALRVIEVLKIKNKRNYRQVRSIGK